MERKTRQAGIADGDFLRDAKHKMIMLQPSAKACLADGAAAGSAAAGSADVAAAGAGEVALAAAAGSQT
jgi:hypothetical protein